MRVACACTIMKMFVKRDLARLHKSGAPMFGLDRDNFIATIPQSNTPHDSWTEFYAVERLEPMMKRAVGMTWRTRLAARKKVGWSFTGWSMLATIVTYL